MLTVGGLFDGCGLLAYGLHLAGLHHEWLCEVDEFRQGLLRQRFPGVTVYPDVRAVDARAARVDVVAGGFPCKGVSSAGKREGFGHPETVLWREMHRVVRDVRPRYVLVENVADLLSLHDGELFGEVLAGLASLGYDCEWDCFPAAAFGAPHGRDRVFLTAVADTDSLAGQTQRSRDWRPGAVDEPSTVERVERLPRLDAAPDAVSGVHRRAGRADVHRSTRAGEGEGPEWERVRAHTADGSSPAADSDDDGRWGLARPQARRDQIHRDERNDTDGRGIPVRWGAYEPAVERWAEIVGRPDPEPLLRRVDDGRARTVERSRLSALGDGVLVQAGWLCGRRILEHAMSVA